MPRDKEQKIKTLSVDNALVGLWHIGTTEYRVDTTGWYYISKGETPYEISPDGQTLKYPSVGTVTTYQRILGAGPSIIGVWERSEVDGSDTWTEEIHFRANGTYTFQWLLNGVFDFEGLGNYTNQLTTIWSEERRALIETTAPNIMSFHPLYAPFQTGTYSISADGNQWTFTHQGNDIVYNKV